MAYDMKVDDSEFLSAGKKISEYVWELSQKMDAYCRIIGYIRETAIRDQLISERLMSLSQQVQAQAVKLAETRQAVQDTCTRFIGDIDDADRFLY